jgi:hypothetical protein
MKIMPAVLCVMGLAALGACAPRAISAIPQIPASSARAADGTSIVYSDNQVLVATMDALRAYPAAVTGSNPTPTATFAYPAGWTPVDVVEAPDRTVYVLLLKKATGRAMVAVYAPNTTTIEQQFKLPLGAGAPGGIALVGDGIDVSTSSAVYTYAYGAGESPSPIRTLNVAGVAAVDKHGRLYAGDYGGGNTHSTVRIYAAGASGNAAPVATLDAGRPYLTGIVVAKDGTIYGHFVDPLGSDVGVQTIPTHGEAVRTITTYTGFVYAMAVDKDGYLYLALDYSPEILYLEGDILKASPHLAVYGGQANGQDPPARTAYGLAPLGQGVRGIALGR